MTLDSHLPRGVVTFVFTDVAGSTALWEQAPEVMGRAMARHDELVEAVVSGHGGVLVRPRGEGDSRFAVFPRASDAAVAALDVQRVLLAEPWETPAPVRVRTAVHTGEADVRDGDYYGRAVNRCARLRSLGWPGQVLLSQATAELVLDTLPPGAVLTRLGPHALPDLLRPETVFSLGASDLPGAFPPLRCFDDGRLAIAVLGPVGATRGGEPLPLGGPARRGVLAALAAEPGRVVPTVELEAVGGPALPAHLAALRRALEPVPGRHTVLVARRPGYALQVPAGTVDVQRFGMLAADAQKELADGRYEPAARGLADALALFAGAPFEGTPLAGSPSAVRLEDLRLAVLEDRYAAELGRGQHGALVPALQELVAGHPARERLWAHLALALHRAGSTSAALGELARARDRLPGGPGPDLLDLERRLRSRDPSLGGPPGAARSRVQLPRADGPVIGREQEVTAVCARLRDPAVRLLTLTGPGGAGKTRLAVEVAARCAPDRPGGVFFVPLAGVVDPGLVLPAVAGALGVTGSADGSVIDACAVSLAGDGTLLVLDNLEQVPGAGPVVGELLAAVPTLQVLVTSRTPVRLRAEREHPVPPLALAEDSCSVEEALGCGAVAMFVARAREACPDFELSADTCADVIRICQRLDGLPLALELAAARLTLLTPSELLARLGSQLGLLVGGPQDLPDRQRTLRATLDWSHGLLGPGPRRLLARLGAFALEFDLAAAEAAAPELPDVLGDLGTLVASSLVWRSVRGERGWFRLPESVREYAAERLRDSGDEPVVRARLAAQLADLVEASHDGLDGPRAPAVLADLRLRARDLAAALDWAVAHEHAELAGRLGGGLRAFWLLEGALTEGRERLRAVLALALPPRRRAQVLLAAGVLAYVQDDAAEADAALARAAELAAQTGELATLATVQGYLGAVGLAAGRVAEAQQLADTALTTAVGLGSYEPHALALSLTAVAAALRGDVEAERAAYERRLVLVRQRGDTRRIAETLNNLSEVALLVGDLVTARVHAEEALDLARGVARLVTRDAQLTLARVELADAALGRAFGLVEQALRLSVELGQEFEVAQCLLVTGAIAGGGGDHERAAQLYGAGSRMRGDTSPLDLDLEPDVARSRDATRVALGEPAYERACAAGLALHRDRAVELALAVAAPDDVGQTR